VTLYTEAAIDKPWTKTTATLSFRHFLKRAAMSRTEDRLPTPASVFTGASPACAGRTTPSDFVASLLSSKPQQNRFTQKELESSIKQVKYGTNYQLH